MTAPSRNPFSRRLPWAALLLLPLLATPSPAVGPVRGRDPWAFRLTLENKTRMLVAALRSDLWVAYNPANGTLHKVWNGGIQFRGKVWDFGQQNSATTGTTYHLLKKAFLFSATNETIIPAGWSATGITTGTSWNLSTAAGTMLVSPAADLRNYDNVMLSYQTPGGDNRLLVDVSNDNGATWTAQQWMSIDAPAADGNMKLVEVNGQAVKVRFRRNTTGSTATLGDVLLFGDYRAWTMQTGGSPVAIKVDWRGYKLINHTDGIVVRYDMVLPGGARVGIEERPEAMTGAKLQRKFTITGMPASSRLSLEIDGNGYQATHAVTGATALRTEAGATFLDFTTNGDATLETTWTP
ncbi:hypothetical protein [Luteolibacter soli]|uniref:Exo-alpha-sialidase n=1 Tax=Luteolibacter soli TaxID=3135280 RepID=A0ABU9ASS7_9BACT